MELGQHNLTITALDSFGHYAEKTVLFNIVNTKPILRSLDDITVDEQELVIIEPVAIDRDGNELTITFDEPLDSSGQWQPGYHDAGVHTGAVHASDGYSTDTKSFTITVENVNQAPGLVTDKSYYSIHEDSPLSFNLVADDIDLIDGELKLFLRQG